MNMIAEGGFSFVYRGADPSSTAQYAVKKVRCQTTDQRRAIEREMHFHKQFSHPNLLPLVDYSAVASQNGYVYYLVFPLYEKGNLRHHIDELRRYSFESKRPQDLFC